MTLTNSDLPAIADQLGADFDPDDASRFGRRYNIAPTDLHWLLVAGDAPGRRRIVPAVWGLPAKGRRGIAINVRGESIARGAFAHQQHGFALANGFFEWKKDGRARRPIWYHRPAGELLLMAAVASPIATASAKAPIAFSVITVPASADVAQVHDRMPALIDGVGIDAWLTSAGSELLVPAPAGTLETTAVSQRVNSVKNDDAGCLAPAPAAADRPRRARQLSLLDGDAKD